MYMDVILQEIRAKQMYMYFPILIWDDHKLLFYLPRKIFRTLREYGKRAIFKKLMSTGKIHVVEILICQALRRIILKRYLVT